MASSPLAEKIRASQDFEERVLGLPRWGATVIVRSPKLKTVDEVKRVLLKHSDNPAERQAAIYDLFPRLVVECAFDADTKMPAFTADDMKWFPEKHAEHFDEIALTALELAGLAGDAAAAAGNSLTPSPSENGATS